MGDRLDIRILGPLEVVGPDGPIPVGGHKQRALLADLVINLGHPLSSDRLITDLWGDYQPPTASGTLQAYLSRLRKSLGPKTIERGATGYRLTVPASSVDATRFRESVARAGSLAETDPAGALRHYRDALGLWRGSPLGDLGAEGFALVDARKLAEERTAARQRLFALELELGNHQAVLAELEAAVQADPLREPLWQLLILALYRSGRQADALRAFRRASRALGQELGIEPGPALVALEERILLQDPELAFRIADLDRRERRSSPTNLREVSTTFLGRESTLALLSADLSERRLVTVVGPGGVGKTRVAVETCWEILDRHPGGVYDVDLAEISTDFRVVPQIASALGIPSGGQRDLDHVVESIGERLMVLLIDNCEHVLEGAAGAVEALLDRCPGLRVLATSRVPLNADGELVRPLGPLPLPEPDETDWQSVARFDAVALFATRGAVAHDGFRVTAANAHAVAEIVRGLDGLPLAIELVAAQLPLLAPAQIADQMREGFPRAVGMNDHSRHATLRAAVDWSYDLLGDEERLLFNRLSVFRGGFSSGEAAEVCGDDRLDETLVPSLIESLRSKSLLGGPSTLSPDGVGRYRFLETMRSYATERLQASRQTPVMRTRHAAWAARRAAECSRELGGADQGEWYRALRSIRLETLAALDHLQVTDRELEKAMLADLWYWWYLDGYLDEGVLRLEAHVGKVGSEPAELLLGGAYLLFLSERSDPDSFDGRGDYGVVADYGRELAETASRLDDPGTKALVRLYVGDAMTAVGRYEEADRLLGEAVEEFAARHDPRHAGWGLLRRVRCAAFGRADFALADQWMEEALALLEEAGDLQHLAYAQLAYASRQRLLSDFPRSLELTRAAQALFGSLGLLSPRLEADVTAVANLTDLGRYEDAISEARACGAKASRHNHTGYVHRAAFEEGRALAARGDTTAATSLLLEVAASPLDWSLQLLVHLNLAALAMDSGRADEAREQLDLARQLERPGVPPWWRSHPEILEGRLALAGGNPAGALDHFRSAAAVVISLPQRSTLAAALESAAEAKTELGDAVAAARLFGAVGRLHEDTGTVPTAARRERTRRLSGRVAKQLGADEYSRLWAEGAEIAAVPGDLSALL